ncbi:hypothetical protein M3Y97_01052900 [Aphelenchoides bicaudatus]|nr:hypothetical protein M3Y97_01052900 [Aphelenchoides bicaudatus]
MNSIASTKGSAADSKASTSALYSAPIGKLKQENEKARNAEAGKIKEEEESTTSPSTASDTHPDEFHGGHWDIDHIQYCNFNPITSRLNDSLSINTLDPKRMKSGAAYRALTDKDTSDYKCFRDEHNELYRVGDFVYMDLDTAYPYVVGKVESFKMKKGAQMTVKVTRLYRREDLLPDSLSLLEAERREAGVIENSQDILVRELFPSDVHLTQSVAVLKGKCQMVHLPIKNALHDSDLDKDTFFYCISYSPDTGRLSACHPEIREGTKFQAVCPKLDPSVIGDEQDRDQLVYKPGNMCSEAEDTVVKYARSYRSLVLLDNPHINELERTAFQGDRVKIDALDCLTRCGYVAADAVKQMVEDDKSMHSFLSADDTKKFVKGLRNYGKNFPKIVKEFLPGSSRESLVHYYYWWKKSGDAFKPKKTNGTVVKKLLFPQPKKPIKSDASEHQFVDYDSVSEDEEPEWGRACHHCYGQKSRDWHHSGPSNQLLCTQCRKHFKRYGTMREVERPKEIPRALLHDESLNGSEEGEEGVKTRASNRRGDRLKTPIDDDKTPIKNGIDVEGERRSTPQRSVKIHKRTYHPSTSSTEETTSPKKNKEFKPIKLKPVHQLALSNKINKTEKQESLDSDDQQQTSNEEDKSSSPKKVKSENIEAAEDVDSRLDPPIEIKDDFQFRSELLANDCVLKRRRQGGEEDKDACARTQFTFFVTNEIAWTARKRAHVERKQVERREKQAKEQAEAHQKALEHEQEQVRQMQLQAANASVAHLPRVAGDLIHHQMRLPGIPPNSMIRPQMPPLPADLMALASTRPELLQAILLQQQAVAAQAQAPNQAVARPQMIPPAFSGGLGGIPPALNPLLAAHNPANAALMFQSAMQQQQQRILEEQKRQQLEQREQEQRRQLQQQFHNQQLQNQQLQNQQQQLLMAMNAFNPQMLAAAGIPLFGLPTSIATSQQLSLPPQQTFTSQHTPQAQFDHAQLLRSTQAGAAAALQQQNQQQQDYMQIVSQLLKQQSQQGGAK